MKSVLNVYEYVPKDCGFYGFVKDEDSCSFKVQSVVCGDLDPAATDTHTTGPPSAVDTPAAPPDLIQCTPTFKVDLKVRRLYLVCYYYVLVQTTESSCVFQSMNKAPPAPPSLKSSPGCPPPREEQNLLTVTACYVVQTLPSWRSPDPYVSALGQGIYTCMQLYAF